MHRLQRAGLKLNPVKCKLIQLRTKFVGHVVSGKGIEPDPEKVRDVVDWPTPRNFTEPRGFVVLASYYRRFVGFFAEIARLIHLLTEKNKPFVWRDKQQKTFEHLKQCLVTAPVLSLPCDECRYVHDSDASDEALDLVLQQEQDGMLKVIAYASRVLQPAEITTARLVLAAIYGLKHFRQFLLGRRFVFRTDNAALISLFRTPEPVGQQARYLDLLGSTTWRLFTDQKRCIKIATL